MSASKRIMVVDDNLEHLEISKLALEDGNYEVLILADCFRLLEQIKEFKPRLIFIDHTMPGTNGLVATRLIKSHALYKDIPVVYFTAKENIRELAEIAGADDWLSKPFDVEEMREKADKYFN